MLINDPVGQKLVEWALLRHAESEARFERYASSAQIPTGRAFHCCASALR
jgi:hypothetical protein